MASETLGHEESSSVIGTAITTDNGYSANSSTLGATWNRKDLNAMINNDLEDGEV